MAKPVKLKWTIFGLKPFKTLIIGPIDSSSLREKRNKLYTKFGKKCFLKELFISLPKINTIFTPFELQTEERWQMASKEPLLFGFKFAQKERLSFIMIEGRHILIPSILIGIMNST
jgi:hypothetical protein